MESRKQAVALSLLTRELSRCCQTKEEQIFAKFDLSSAEGRMLLAIADSGPITPSGVADLLGLGRSRLTPLADHLVQKGLLSRTESASDRRVRTLALTPAGRDAARAALDYQITFHEQLLKMFAPDERQRMLASLDQLHGAIEKMRTRISKNEA